MCELILFWGLNNGRLWEKELGGSAQKVVNQLP